MRFISTTFLGLLLCLSLRSSAQYSYNISGYITDTETGEALVGAKVSIPDWQVEAFTNHYGYYSISLPPQDVIIYFEYQDYESQIDTLYIDADLLYNVNLFNLIDNPDDAVNTRKSQNAITSMMNGKIDLPLPLSTDLPYMFSEPDFIKTLQTLPGVEMGNEGFSNLFIRGGAADQNLILVDDMPLYNTNHMFGLWSTLNPDGLNSVQLMKGGLPARYGGRLSSVIDISTKEGNLYETDGSASVSPITANVHVNGPIKDSTTTFAISGRRTYLDVLLAPLFASPDLNAQLNYHDLMFKFSHKLSAYDRIYFSFFNSRDILGTSGTFEDSVGYSEQTLDLLIKWGNNNASLRWTHIFSPKFFGAFAVTTSNYSVNNGISLKTNYLQGNLPNSESSFDYMNAIRDLIFKGDFEYKGRNDHWMRFGLNATRHSFKPGVLKTFSKNVQGSGDIDQTSGAVNWIFADEIALYAEDEYRASGNWRFNYGLRAVYYQKVAYQKFFPEPRLMVNYVVNETFSMKTSVTRVHQFVNLLTNRGTNQPSLIWVPSDQDVEPQRCDQIAFALNKTLKNESLFTLDLYYKNMTNLVQPISSSDFSDVETDWKEEIDIGNGRAWGAEFMLQRNFGNLKGWMSYTYSRSDRQFNLINNNIFFPFNFDRRHVFKLAGVVKNTYAKSTSFNFSVGSGLPFTLPVAKYLDINGDEIVDFGTVNNYRAPTYIRLDVSWIRDLGYITPAIRHKASFSVYNILLNRNPNNVFAERTVSSNGTLYTAYKSSSFMFIPGLNYKWIF